jgi:hypothetical protein
VSGGHLFLVGGETAGGALSSDVQFVTPNRAFGLAGTPGAGSPYYDEELLVPDRGNNRLVLLNDTGKTIWTYPSKNAPPPPRRFLLPGRRILYPPWNGDHLEPRKERHSSRGGLSFRRLVFSYGHPRTPGSAPGYLNTPDDAYLLHNGDITVAGP